MIHILTVHWRDERWIDIQLRFLNEHIHAPFRVYAFLNGLARDHRSKYFYASTEEIRSHPVKLNLLADMVTLHAAPGDWLLFLDGDAFPVDDVVSFARDKLERHRLLAIRRTENAGDPQPHPSFCLTTVRFWKEICGDWKPGFEWRNAQGQMTTDVGGNLLHLLNQMSVDWYPLARSNRRNLHPLWFGLYDDVVYHHGAGFRNPVSRADWQRQSITGITWLDKVLRKAFRQAARRCIYGANRRLSADVYKSIASDPEFHRQFREPAADTHPTA